MIGRMPSPYGHAIAVAVFLFVLTLSPVAHAAETNALTITINDPITDVIQLWSTVLTSIESLAQQLAAVVQPSLTASTSPKPHIPKNLTPPALAASAALATQSLPETATTSVIVSGTSITPQQPQSTNPPGVTSDQTTRSLKSTELKSSTQFNLGTGIPASTFVTQNQFNAGLSALTQSLRQLIFQTASAPVVSGPGAPLPVEAFAPSQRIDQLTNTTLTNVTVNGISGITAANVPALQNYLLLTGGTLTGALVNSSTASSSFLGALGVGTTSPSDIFAVNGPIYLANVTPAATTNRLYSNAGSLYWAGNLVGGGAVGNWTSDGTNVWRAAGNVGIGTTSPSYALDILNSGFQLQRLLSPNNDALITLGSNIASSQYWTFGATSNISGQGSNLFTIDTSNINGGGVTQRLVINSSGNVGIGTTTPQSALAVSSGESIGANYNLAAPSNG